MIKGCLLFRNVNYNDTFLFFVFGMVDIRDMIPKYGNIFRLDITVMITQSNELLCLASLIWSDLMIRQKYERNPSCLNALNAR